MNFFQMPNFLWDREDLDVYERTILTHIVRKTIGWGKSEDGISLGQFQKALGISKSTTIRTLKKLINKNIIVKKSNYSENGAQSFNFYSLTDEIIKLANSSVSDEQGGCLRDTGGSISETQGGVSERHTQNTSNTKDTNTKEKTNKKENSSDELQTFVKVWNEYAEKFNLTRVEKLTKSRRNKLKTRLRENPTFLMAFDKALQQLEDNSFLRGENKNGWKINFDWLISNDTNYVKVIEGAYKDKAEEKEPEILYHF